MVLPTYSSHWVLTQIVAFCTGREYLLVLEDAADVVVVQEVQKIGVPVLCTTSNSQLGGMLLTSKQINQGAGWKPQRHELAKGVQVGGG